MRLRKIKNKLYTHLKNEFPQYTFIKENGNKINVYSIYTALYSHLICYILIQPSIIYDNYYLITVNNSQAFRDYKTIRTYYTPRNGFSIQTEWNGQF